MAVDRQETNTTQQQPRVRTRWLWIYALLLTGLVVYFVLPETIGSQIRNHLLKVMQLHWQDHQVKIGTVRFEPGLGVILHDLRIWERNAAWNEAPMLQISRIICRTRVQWDELIGEPFASDQLRIEGMQCQVRPARDGSWPLLKLWPPPKLGKGCPVLVFRNGRLRFFQGQNSAVACELRELNGEVRSTATGTEFEFASQSDCSETIRLRGTRSPRGDLNWVGYVDQMRIDPALIRRLPSTVSATVKEVEGLSCIADVRVRFSQRTSEPPKYAAAITLQEARYVSSRLPVPLESFHGTLVLRPEGVHLEKLTGRLADAEVQVSGYYGLREPNAELKVSARGLTIQPQLLTILPEKIRNGIDQVRPRGMIHADATFILGEKWSSAGTIELLQADIQAAKFPYPVSGVTGRIHWRGPELETENMRGVVAGQNASGSLKLTMTTGGPMDLRLNLEGPAPIDETLLRALTPRGTTGFSKTEQVVRSLSPQGQLRLHTAKFHRDAQGKSTRQIRLSVQGGRMHYLHFPYQLTDIDGQIEIDQDGVRFDQLRGQNNEAATIQVDGRWQAGVEGTRGRLELQIQGSSVPLDDSLRSALPASTRSTWDALEPSGNLDQLLVQLTMLEGEKPVYGIFARQFGTPRNGQRTVSLRPKAIPYRLDVHEAVVRMNGDSVLIEKLDGWHGASHLATQGRCARRLDGLWELHLDVLPGSRLQTDADLMEAVPESARNALSQLNLQGLVGIRGATKITLPGEANAGASNAQPNGLATGMGRLNGPEMYWDVTFQLEGNQLGLQGEANAIRGEATCVGTRLGDQIRARGDLNIDSLHVWEVQGTQLRGPYEIREQTLYWGKAVSSEGDARGLPDSIQANLFGGRLASDGKLSFASSRFQLTATVNDAYLPTMLADLGSAQSTARGRCGVLVRQLSGSLGERRSWEGAGAAYLREASLAQLPPILKLLNELRISPSDDSAFTTGNAEFLIDGERVEFSSLQLEGDYIALYGTGYVNTRRDLQLNFDTRVSPQNVWSKVVSPIYGKKYNLWSLQVTGTLDDYKISRNPRMEQALDRLGLDGDLLPRGTDELPVLGNLPILNRLKW
jgi:hypothetical protein